MKNHQTPNSRFYNGRVVLAGLTLASTLAGYAPTVSAENNSTNSSVAFYDASEGSDLIPPTLDKKYSPASTKNLEGKTLGSEYESLSPRRSFDRKENKGRPYFIVGANGVSSEGEREIRAGLAIGAKPNEKDDDDDRGFVYWAQTHPKTSCVGGLGAAGLLGLIGYLIFGGRGGGSDDSSTTTDKNLGGSTGGKGNKGGGGRTKPNNGGEVYKPSNPEAPQPVPAPVRPVPKPEPGPGDIPPATYNTRPDMEEFFKSIVNDVYGSRNIGGRLA